jgi:hypothetical protein
MFIIRVYAELGEDRPEEVDADMKKSGRNLISCKSCTAYGGRRVQLDRILTPRYGVNIKYYTPSPENKTQSAKYGRVTNSWFFGVTTIIHFQVVWY